jgi:tight adherence protein C
MSQIAILGSFFLFVMGGTVLAGYWLLLRPRLAERQGEPSLEDEVAHPLSGVARLLGAVGDALPKSADDITEFRRRLTSAGYRVPGAVSTFIGIKFAAVVAIGLLVGIIAFLNQLSLFRAAFAALCGAGFAFKLIDRILAQLIRARSRRIRSALPSALDLLVLSVESGQSLDQAIVNTSRELSGIHPELSTELALAHFELQLGKTRAESLRMLAERTDEAELRKLTTLLIETDKFGTSPGPALRSHSKYLRVRMKQEAQEAARKVSVKLVFPVFFLIFPSVLLVTLGPAVLLMLEQLRILTGP